MASPELEQLIKSLLTRANQELEKGDKADLDVVASLTDRVLKFEVIKAKGGAMGEEFES